MKKEIINILKKCKWQIIIEIIFLTISIFCIIFPSKIIGKIIDLLYNMDENKLEIYKSICYLLLSCFGVLITRLIWKNIDFYLDLKMNKNIKDRLFAKLMKTKIEDISTIKNGEIMSYFVSDSKNVTKSLAFFISNITRIILNFVIIMFMMSDACNIKLTFFTSIPIVITIIIVIIIRNRVYISFKAAQKSFTDLSEYVQESTDSIRTMKAFVGGDRQTKDFKNKNAILKNDNLKVTKNQNLLDICINLGFGIAYSVSLLYGSKLVIQGEISIGDLVAFNGYLAMLEMPVSGVPMVLKKYKKFKISYERLDKMFALKEEKIQIYSKKDREFEGNIEIKNLTYNYPGYIEKVLENINIDVKKGETLGIIGVIGSGKTTLMNLLLKLYDVENGKIFIDGKDINDIPTEKIRQNICYITQDSFLFSASLKENINLFRDDYEDNKIEESTKKAMIYEDISEMKEGIYTIIGEKGIDLSGGQKQRVVISRAFLNNSNIVIFDDTFSALDNRTEQHVLNNIKELTKDKTCIIISNRISDIKDCDKIIVLEQGKILERGNHKSLINNQGKYYKFFKNQAHKTEASFLG